MAEQHNLTGDSTLSYLFNRVWDKLYPVGAIYISSNATSPEKLFGGKWKQIEDQFLLAAGRTYRAGDTGGEATHTLTENEMPSHSHVLKGWIFSGRASSEGYKYGIRYDYNTGEFFTLSDPYNTGQIPWGDLPAGGGKSHNNMPPYRVVYAWERTA